MEGDIKERWQELCEIATKEQDPAKMLALVQEINRLLEEKQARLDEARRCPPTTFPATKKRAV